MAEEVRQQFYVRAISKASDIKKQESVLHLHYRELIRVRADYFCAEWPGSKAAAEYAQFQSTFSSEFDVKLESDCKCFYRSTSPSCPRGATARSPLSCMAC